ncbi:hypothetical protein [Gemmatimonas sp.]|uniref:hypothetical protein n=1 Tax=Gemmatimonas sp. TaxID=1962908 RepID=UPI00398393F8
MHTNSKWTMLGMASLLVLSACGGTPKVAAKSNNKVRVEAKCVSLGVVNVKVDQWAVDVDRDGSIDWILETGGDPATDAIVTIEPKNANAPWPFTDRAPITPTVAGANKKVRPNAGGPGGKSETYRYNIRIVCGLAPNQQTVVIDPDIIVN